MTAKQVFEGMLIELSKVHAPSLLLEDFNYLFNKAVNQYINKRYNIYDVNQQTADDLRVLKSTAIIDAKKSDRYSKAADIVNKYTTSLFGSTYEVNLPSDYLHILNCICFYKVNKTYKCYDAGSYVPFSARRLTADAWSQVINDFYNRPVPQRPYYYIHNVNSNNQLPTNPVVQNYNTSTSIKFDGTDQTKALYTKDSITSIPYDYSHLDKYCFLPKVISTPVYVANPLTSRIYYDNLNNLVYQIYDKDTSSWKTSTTDGKTAYIKLINISNTINSSTTETIDKFEAVNDAKNKDLIIGSELSNITITTPFKYNINGTYCDYRTYKIPIVILSEDPNNLIWNDINYGSASTVDDILNILNSINEYPRTIKLSDIQNSSISTVEKSAQVRYGNTSNVRMEIRYGKDNSIFELQQVMVDYIKVPQFIRLTQEQLDLTEDTSQIMEFPDFVCQEIINELVTVVMENNADPRLQTHLAVSQSIAQPQQAQQVQQQAQQEQ